MGVRCCCVYESNFETKFWIVAKYYINVCIKFCFQLKRDRRMSEGRRTHHSCRVLSTCCVLCCLLVHHGCAAQSKEQKADKDPVLTLFEKYGDGDVLDYKGLEKLMRDLRISPHQAGTVFLYHIEK